MARSTPSGREGTKQQGELCASMREPATMTMSDSHWGLLADIRCRSVRSALNSQQGTELTEGRQGIRNVLDVPYVSHLIHTRRTRKEEYSREDFVANEQEAMLTAYIRNDQPNTIKHHLHYTSARVAVDKILLTDSENG